MSRIADQILPPDKRSDGFRPGDTSSSEFPLHRAEAEPCTFIEWVKKRGTITFDMSRQVFRPATNSGSTSQGWGMYGQISNDPKDPTVTLGKRYTRKLANAFGRYAVLKLLQEFNASRFSEVVAAGKIQPYINRIEETFMLAGIDIETA